MKAKYGLYIFWLVILPLATFSQKAFEAVYYTGKTKNFAVTFKLANGFLGGGEIKTKTYNSKTSSTFLPESGGGDENKKIKFYHFSPAGKSYSDYFIIDGVDGIL